MAAHAETEYRMLNESKHFVVGGSDEAASVAAHAELMTKLDKNPFGKTPLCAHLREVIVQIQQLEPELRQNGQKAVVIIATDGQVFI
jgi:hypothetical protein